MTVGSEIAFYSTAFRRKYGTYARGSLIPGVRLWAPIPIPLENHEDDELPAFPDTSEKALMWRPMNRADDRQRFKSYRVTHYAKDLHRSFNDRRKALS